MKVRFAPEVRAEMDEVADFYCMPLASLIRLAVDRELARARRVMETAKQTGSPA